MSNKKIISLIIIISILFCSSSVYSLSLNDLLKKQTQIEKQKDVMENQISKIEKQKDTIENQIGTINDKISKVQESLNSINLKLINNESKIISINKDIDTITNKQKEQQKALEKRLKVYYENDNASYLDVLFSSENLADLLWRLDVIKQIVTYDKSIIDQMEDSIKNLDSKKSEFEIVKNDILVSKQQYNNMKTEHLQVKTQKNQLLSQLTEEQRKIEKEYELEEEQSNNIARQIQKYQGSTSSTPYSGGKFNWPAVGCYTITSQYGMRFHPVLKTNKMHTGIDINAGTGTNVVAASDGTIISSGNISGYGNTVIIDHGGGISTLYGHNSVLLVKAGQKVKKGQSIAKSGSTGISTGPHVHFEVRVNGSPVNPMSYLK